MVLQKLQPKQRNSNSRSAEKCKRINTGTTQTAVKGKNLFFLFTGKYTCISGNVGGTDTADTYLIVNDRDECQTSASLCKQICKNTYGSYTCSCYDGYALLTDKVTCQGNFFILMTENQQFKIMYTSECCETKTMDCVK